MGSLRPVVLFRHFHLKFNFTELWLETVRQSLRHSCRTELTRQGISLPSDRQGYSRRLLGLELISYTYNFSSYSTGQASDSIHHYEISQSPVFLVNSRYLLFFDTMYGPPCPEVTELFCRVPSITFSRYLSIFYPFTRVRLNTLLCWPFSSFLFKIIWYNFFQIKLKKKVMTTYTLWTYDNCLFLRERILHKGPP